MTSPANHTTNNKFIELIAAILILLFTYTATSKLLSLAAFQTVLAQSPLIGGYAKAISITIPAIELIVSVLLFIPPTRLLGLYASAAMMIVFTGYIGYMILYTPHLPCSCGGVIRNLNWNQHLLFNIFFLGLAITGIILPNRNMFLYINRRSRKPV